MNFAACAMGWAAAGYWKLLAARRVCVCGGTHPSQEAGRMGHPGFFGANLRVAKVGERSKAPASEGGRDIGFAARSCR
jgi:hypothetical protein